MVRLDLDPEWAVEPGAGFDDAVRSLLLFAFATIPDGCALDFSSARSPARLAPIGAGHWALRWQVTGSRDADREAGEAATPIHPRPGSARDHLASGFAERVREAFSSTDWEFRIDAVVQAEELVARAARL
jgi:hypothetical protein